MIVVAFLVVGRARAFVNFLISDIFIEEDRKVIPVCYTGVNIPRRAAVLLEVRGVHGGRQTKLLHVGCAGDGFRLFTCFGKRGLQHGRQDGDDGDDDQKFDKGKCFFHDCLLYIL